MTTNLHDKMLAAIDAYFSSSDGDERDQAEEQLLDVRDEINKQPAQQEPVAYGMWDTMLGKDNRMMMVRLDKGQDGCTVPLYTSPQPPAHSAASA